MNKHKTLNAILMEVYFISDQTQKSVYVKTFQLKLYWTDLKK